jgi:hypothetical protein
MKGKRIRKESGTVGGVREGIGTGVNGTEEERGEVKGRKENEGENIMVEEQRKRNSRKKRMINLEEGRRIRNSIKPNSRSVEHGAE